MNEGRGTHQKSLVFFVLDNLMKLTDNEAEENIGALFEVCNANVVIMV